MFFNIITFLRVTKDFQYSSIVLIKLMTKVQLSEDKLI